MRTAAFLGAFVAIVFTVTGCPSSSRTPQPLPFRDEPFRLNATEVNIPEGGSFTLQITLDARPSQTLNFNVGISGDDDISFAAPVTSLTFTPQDYNIPQELQILAADDRDSENGRAFFFASLEGSNDDDAERASIVVNEIDNDTDLRLSGLYLGVPLSADSAGASLAGLTGPGVPSCGLVDAPLTYAAGDDITRKQGLDLEAGRRIFIPVLNGPGIETAMGTSITAQVLDTSDGYIVAIFLKDNAVPVNVVCSDPLAPGEAWEFGATPGSDVSSSAVRAYLYAMHYEDGVTGDPATFCAQLAQNLIGNASAFAAFDQSFIQDVQEGTKPLGPHIAAVVRRIPGDQDVATAGLVSAVYNGLSDDMYGTTELVAPYVTTSKGLDTTLHLFNSGSATASVSVLFTESATGNTFNRVAFINPQSGATLDARGATGGDFVGSARIQGDQPLAAVVDLTGPGPVAATYPATRTDAGTGQLVAPCILESGWTITVAAHNLSNSTASMTMRLNNETGGLSSSRSEPVQAGRTRFVERQINRFNPTKVGMAEILSFVAPAAGVLVGIREDEDSGAVTGLMAANLVSLGTIHDVPAQGAIGFGVKVVGVPLAGRNAPAEGLATELIVHNANPEQGETAFALYVYDGAVIREFCAGTLLRLHSQLVPIDFTELGDGFHGPLIVAATSCDQDGGPALTAAVIQRARHNP